MLSDFSADFRTATIGRVRLTNQDARLTALLELREDVTADVESLQTSTADPACLAILEAQQSFLLIISGMIVAAEAARHEIVLKLAEVTREAAEARTFLSENRY